MQEKSAHKKLRVAAEWHENIAKQMLTPILPDNILPEELREKSETIREQRQQHLRFARAINSLLAMKPKIKRAA